MQPSYHVFFFRRFWITYLICLPLFFFPLKPSGFIFLLDSIFVGCMLLEIYSFILGYPISWYIIIHNSLFCSFLFLWTPLHCLPFTSDFIYWIFFLTYLNWQHLSSIHWRRKWLPTPVFFPGESHGQRSLAGYCPWVCKSRTQLTQFSQFSSVSQSCLTLCKPMNHSTSGLPVHHQLPEFTQTHVHRVSDAIQPSHPLSSPSPPAANPSQHQGIFQWLNSGMRWPKYWSFSFSIIPSNEHPGQISFRMDWLDLLAVQGTLKSLIQPQFKSIIFGAQLSSQSNSHIHDYWKKHSLD